MHLDLEGDGQEADTASPPALDFGSAHCAQHGPSQCGGHSIAYLRFWPPAYSSPQGASNAKTMIVISCKSGWAMCLYIYPHLHSSRGCHCFRQGRAFREAGRFERPGAHSKYRGDSSKACSCEMQSRMSGCKKPVRNPAAGRRCSAHCILSFRAICVSRCWTTSCQLVIPTL